MGAMSTNKFLTQTVGASNRKSCGTCEPLGKPSICQPDVYFRRVWCRV